VLLREWCADVDEVGRGPLAGAVFAAAVVLDPFAVFEGLSDSKALTARQREELDDAIKSRAIAWSIARADVEEIDRINILQASLLAMARAVAALPLAPAAALVDGRHCPPGLPCRSVPVVGGDGLCLAIAAASIIAKTVRDALMAELDTQHPAYGWCQNQGYPTPAHLSALARHGPTPWHRRSFAPVMRAMASISGP